jgi:hypothetical protein
MNSSANLDVEFANQLKWGKGTHNCHPTWQTCYFDAEGKIIRDFRKPKSGGAEQGQTKGSANTLNGGDGQLDDNDIDGDAAVPAYHGL